jgi:hypothetical protein
MASPVIYKVVFTPDKPFVVQFPRRATGEQLRTYILQTTAPKRHLVLLPNMHDSSWVINTLQALTTREEKAGSTCIIPENYVQTLKAQRKAHQIYKQWKRELDDDQAMRVDMLETPDDGISSVTFLHSKTPIDRTVRFGQEYVKEFKKAASPAYINGQTPHCRKMQRNEIKACANDRNAAHGSYQKGVSSDIISKYVPVLKINDTVRTVAYEMPCKGVNIGGQASNIYALFTDMERDGVHAAITSLTDLGLDSHGFVRVYNPMAIQMGTNGGAAKCMQKFMTMPLSSMDKYMLDVYLKLNHII